ncbi:hypothetical protein [Pseudoalteromonas luteoviolacea]|uniref:Uncharacterized protein n=1 Tax=Pseudoalteromonas luteoviolacea NCIMB 1942 TaxID=1365253 RepID=A0A167HCF2_9GAMM|nr:hypothetical protein [Pseudoalteromonas luteoviolacea]KZN57968.1 hypothetical protein N482_22975 [Pseudoalteromonas luteoviolacea NCIMB 1942]KZX01726.1 hypothetical protein JL49_04195 [Pseudoalteromonas luteoviolacea]
MFKYSKVALGLATCFTLTGCLEVEDDSNKEVADRLDSQNQILQQQVDILKEQQANTEAPAVVVGKVASATEGVTVADAKVSVFVNNAWTAAVSVSEDGTFSIDGLPASRDIVVRVASESNAFLTRHFMTTTSGYVAAGVDSTIDLLNLEVSEGVTKEFSILDSKSEEVVKGLTIWADDLIATHNSWKNLQFVNFANEEFATKATFNEEKGVYQIQVAKDLPVDLLFSADVDNDGNVDYRHETLHTTNNGHAMLARAANVDSTHQIYLDAINAHEFTVALTVLDESGNEMKVRRVVVEGNDRGADNAVYDEASKQYAVEANFFGELALMIPSFEADGVVYQSRNVRVNYNEYNSAYSVYSDNGHYQAELSDNTLNIVTSLESFIPSEASAQAVKTVAAKSLEDNAVQIYFNVPVELVEGGISTQASNRVVVSGGGTSYAETTSTDVAYNAVLDLDNTRLTITADGEFEANYEYRVNVSSIKNLVSGETEDAGVYVSHYYLSKGTDFDINTLTADNFNFTTDGTPIVAANSAGVTSTATDYSNDVRLILPQNLNSVENLTLRIDSYVMNNTSVTNENPIEVEVVGNGYQYNNYREYVANVAHNETYWGFSAGANVENGYYRMTRSYDTQYLSLSDNKTGNANSVTVYYSYQLKSNAEVKTGTLTLPIN